MCVELMYYVINSGFSLKTTWQCVLCPGFLLKIDCAIFHEVSLPKFGDVIVECFVHKMVFGFLPFCFYYRQGKYCNDLALSVIRKFSFSF